MRKTDFQNDPRLDVFKASLVEGARFSERYEFPVLEGVSYQPGKAIPFDKAAKAKELGQWVHFYTYDRNFECLWNKPKQYLGMLQRFDGVITPDFSLYRDMPLAMQIWNTYRGRVIGYWLQRNGVSVVPNVRWGDERTYEFAFEGLARGGTVAVSTCGCIQHRLDRHYFKKGLVKMVEVLSPETIVNYSRMPEDLFGWCREQGIDVIGIENYADTIRRETV